METNEKFQYGDVLVEIGKLGKWVVTAFTWDGTPCIDKVQEPNKYHPDGYELLEWGRCVIFNEPNFIKVGRWDFTNKCEIDADAY